MGSENSSWHAAFVMSFVHPDKYFFVVIDKGISAILKGGKGIQLGDFYEVQYAFNSQAKEENRAKHLIIHLRPINPLAQVRTNVDERSRPHVILTTTAKFDGMVNARSKRVAKLYNDTFGNFIDLGDLVQQRDKLIEFEFKCKASQKDESLSIFVPTKILHYYDLPFEEERRPSERKSYMRNVIGFVCSKTQQDRSKYLWSKDLDDDVRLEHMYCPSNVDVTGKWIEALVDIREKKVADQAFIVEDMFRTRLYRGVPEVYTEFRYFEFDRNEGIDVYMSTYFGRIRDPHNMIQFNGSYGSYSGFIVRHRTEHSRIGWKVSEMQNFLSPRIERAPSRESIHYRERPGSRQSHYSFISAQQSRNEDGAFYNDSDHLRGQYSQRHNSYSDIEQNDVQEVPSRASSRAQTTSEEESGDENHRMSIPRNRSASFDVVPGSRRQIKSEIHSNMSVMSDSENDEENYQKSGPRSSDAKRQLSRPPITEACTPPRSDRASVSSFYATLSGNIPSTAQKSSTHSNAEKRERRLQKLASDKCMATLKYLTDNETVLNAMKMYDSHQYEELKKLESSQTSYDVFSSQQNSSAETANEISVLKLKKFCGTVDLFVSSPIVSDVMKVYDAMEYESLLKTVHSGLYESTEHSSVEQQDKLLKLKWELLILQTQYFAEDSNVVNAWESIDYDKCQFILNGLRQ